MGEYNVGATSRHLEQSHRSTPFQSKSAVFESDEYGLKIDQLLKDNAASYVSTGRARRSYVTGHQYVCLQNNLNAERFLLCFHVT